MRDVRLKVNITIDIEHLGITASMQKGFRVMML